MKQITFYITAFFLFLMVSCDKQLDTSPTLSVDDPDPLKTSKDVEGALIGAYSDLGSSSFYGGNIFVCADLLGNSDELFWSGTFQGMTQIFNKDIPIDNGFVSDTWLTGYRTINDVNNVLAKIDIVVEANKARVEGEAKFIRGCIYFDLVRMFGKAWNDGDPNANDGVPLILTPKTTTGTISDADKVSRSSVAEVYAQAISDLSDAENLLEPDKTDFANAEAAAAMLARVYLQKGDYANARDAADRAISMAVDNGYELSRTYYDEFPYINPPIPQRNSPEDIFAIQVTNSSGTNDFQTYYSLDGRGDIAVEDAHLDLYEAGDDRYALFADDYYVLKFENVYGNVRILRLAELYLVRAEANFRLGTTVGATPLADINVIRKRATIKVLKEADLTLDAILHERKVELAFECGNQLHDAKRLEQNVGPYAWNDPKLIYPVPQREIRVNTNLTQNEGY